MGAIGRLVVLLYAVLVGFGFCFTVCFFVVVGLLVVAAADVVVVVAGFF